MRDLELLIPEPGRDLPPAPASTPVPAEPTAVTPVTPVAPDTSVPPVARVVLTLEEACRLLTIGRTKMYQLLNSGALPSRYIDRRRVVLAADIEAFLAALPTERAAWTEPAA